METQVTSRMNKVLLIINCIILTIGTCGAPLIMRLYFIKGGKRICLQTVAWPINFIPLAISYLYRRKNNNNNNNSSKLILMTPRIFMPTIGIGILQGLSNYFYSYGVAKLPVSTNGLVISTQLAFIAFFAFIIVRLKLTSYSVFLLTIGTLALTGLIFPLVELIYNKKAHQAITYTFVLEFQTLYCFVATVFSTIGMVINNDFQAFELGEGRYYVVIICIAIVLQFYFLGTIGVIYSASSLVSGILATFLLPVTEVLAVFLYGKKFSAEKGISLALSLWGFASYFYGDYKENNKRKNDQSLETKTIESSRRS
ncbi:hypothetical protein H5410_031841 [Solanum commersonii]|uniref:Probable purine permease n=1 Tax=Solanum commersonii TaxID=4109 RepID=A0A9J5YL51_SOLCO|nr:hypothetical protein H5410_031841 [Solanum commersonii]